MPKLIVVTPHLLLDRVRSLQQRRRRAKRFRIPFRRDRDWKLPQCLQIAGKRERLSLPDDLGTRIAFKDIFISDVYGLETLNHPPETILDVGAHAGLFSLAARHHFPGATIHAYEPNPALWKHLRYHAELGKFCVYQEAVSLRSGRATLEFPGDTVFTKTTFDEHGGTVVTRFADVVRRLANEGSVDLLKLDCEGAEWSILGDATTMRRIRRVTMEYHLDSKNSLRDLISILSNLGFTIEAVHEDAKTNGRVVAYRSDRV